MAMAVIRYTAYTVIDHHVNERLIRHKSLPLKIPLLVMHVCVMHVWKHSAGNIIWDLNSNEHNNPTPNYQR